MTIFIINASLQIVLDARRYTNENLNKIRLINCNMYCTQATIIIKKKMCRWAECE